MEEEVKKVSGENRGLFTSSASPCRNVSAAKELREDFAGGPAAHDENQAEWAAPRQMNQPVVYQRVVLHMGCG